ncbi:MAG: alginate lyase [Alphaproteobacteria bacterium]|nr:alginate lyase [Alphaproteobacteria bacterium]
MTLSRRRALEIAAATLAWPNIAAAAEPAFALVPAPLVAAARQSMVTPMGAYALRAAQRTLERMPQPLPVVHTEGTLPGQGIYDQSVEAKRDWQAALDAALGSAVGGNAMLAEKAMELVSAWLPVYRISLNPIDETDWDRMMLALDLVLGPARERVSAAFTAFCRSMATGYLDAMPRVRGGTATNNWQSHRVKLATLAAFAAGDARLAERAHAAFRRQLADNIRRDGTVLDFAERDALHYVVYDLEPLAVSALAAKTHGQDWYADGNGALARALNWLAPYAQGVKTHVEYGRSIVEFDRVRAAAGMPGFGGLWQRDTAEYLFALAARLDTQFLPLANALTPGFEGTRRPRAPWLHLTMPV